jgi:hypothetical protein
MAVIYGTSYVNQDGELRKFEIRSSKFEENSKLEVRMIALFDSIFEFRICFEFRISSFGFFAFGACQSRAKTACWVTL